MVDGGSTDATVQTARPLADLVLLANRGRAAQMNAGAKVARGDILLFLHADTRLPSDAVETVQRVLADGRPAWGRFDVKINSKHRLLRVVAWCMNLRSRLTGVATGDQAFFVRRNLFEAAGAFPELALMEDVALSKILKCTAPPICLRTRVITSGRRWEAKGVVRTILLMWLLRFGYWLGCNPALLARFYA